MSEKKPSNRLSKSTFLRGLQCPKSLWLYKHAYELQDETPAETVAVFNRGHDVGRLAWGLFPGGVDLSPEYVDGAPVFAGSMARTREELGGGAALALYEPAFEHDGVFAAVDIMVRDGGRWRVFEVKSGTSVKDVYVTDAALQHWVLAGSGVDVADFSIVHVRRGCRPRSDGDPNGMFVVASVIDQVRARYEEIGREVGRLKGVIALDAAPPVATGPQCSTPYDCSFRGYCSNGLAGTV